MISGEVRGIRLRFFLLWKKGKEKMSKRWTIYFL